MSRPSATTPGTLQRESISCPVTALAFFWSRGGRLYVLSGEDASLVVYDVGTSRRCGQLRAFAAQPVHGISVGAGSASDVLVWGAQSVAVLPRSGLEKLIRGEAAESPVEATAPDWVYGGVLSPSDRGLGVVVTGHNELVPFQVGPDGEALAFGRLRSPSRPILCSAHVSWLSHDCLLVVGGTMFSEIIVWKCHLGRDSARDCEVLFVFSGHEGSVFGVAVSPEIELPNGRKGRLLASCSDDRTIRVWDIAERPRKEGQVNQEALARLQEIRETGFGRTEAITASLEETSQPLALATGHVSRIWNVEFACPTRLTDVDTVTIHSFGEDATAQQWELRLDVTAWAASLETVQAKHASDAAIGSLTHVRTVHAHSGKHIWSAALCPPPHCTAGALIATGGSDGAINLIGRVPTSPAWREAEPAGKRTGRDGQDSRTISISISDVLSHLPVQREETSTHEKKDCLNRYVFLPGDRFFTITRSGRIFIGDLEEPVKWAEVEVGDDVHQDLASYQVVGTSGAGEVFLGSASGRLYAYDDARGLRTVAQLSGKITDVFCLSNQDTSPGHADGDSLQPSASRLLVTTLGHAVVHLVDLSASDAPPTISKTVLDDAFTATAAAVCNGYLVLGSRRGHILVYRDEGPGAMTRVCRVDSSTKDAVSCIVPVPGKAGAAASPYFLTTARDGRCRIYEIDGSGEPTAVLLRHDVSPPLGPMLEGARFVRAPGGGEPELVICGFRGKYFAVWNESTRQELASVECGGAGRAFAYLIDPRRAERLRVIWTQASRTYLYAQARTRHRRLKPGGHGREIRSVSSSAGGGLLATGAEDTQIRLWRREAGRPPRCLAVLKSHANGVQALRWAGDDCLLSSAGGEEFYVWRVAQLDSDYRGLAVVREAACEDRTAGGDQRITAFDVDRLPDGSMRVSLAASNSTLRTYHYSRRGGFRLLAAGAYTGACLTQVRHLRMGAAALHVLTASTDGHVALWRAELAGPGGPGARPGYRLVRAAGLHQGAVKGLDVRARPGPGAPGAWLVATGGDDGALGVLDLAWDPAARAVRVAGRARVRAAHAAGVTGVAITGAAAAAAAAGAASVVTCGNDQRVKTWRLTGGGGAAAPRAALLADRYSAVADADDLAVAAGAGAEELVVVVAGVGLEVWSRAGEAPPAPPLARHPST